ncbi:MAG: FliA/WhiG family RNA polymerase sigma factor [Desulfovibrionaceae bacterium]|nr:FliA/WhiG family RNA polymerase sigma factor [Desulfovibrionaceae bacterium]
MATSSFSGKNSSSAPDTGDGIKTGGGALPSAAFALEPWERMESGETAWDDFPLPDKERIVRHYAPKIRFLALRLKVKLPRNVELSELISAGTLGLLEALGKFRPQMGIRFETYSENRIRGAMLDELRRLDWFPRSLRQRVRQIDGAMRHLEHEKGRPPTVEEIQEHTGLPAREVHQGMEALQNQLCVSLDTIQDSLAGEPDVEGEPFRNTAKSEMVERIAALIDTLTPREKLVLSLYYTDELNMRETAAVMGITEGRVSQLHSQALNRLRREFQSQFGESGNF